ncbi:MAG: hypothetical protein H6824_01185 [Planctomycetaceae bacterium]|nr:hypothetical protein [Planctomycetaceae bacterium]
MSCVPQDQIRTKSDQVAIDEGAFWDDSEAQKVKAFIERFCFLPDGERAGTRVKLIPWVWQELILPLYSWRRKDGKRLKTRGSIWTPKKQTKSSTLSFLSLYELMSVEGAEVYLVSSTVESASHIFKYAKSAIEQSPELAKVLHVQPHTRTITYKKKRSVLKVLSGERTGKQGHNASALFFDELADLTEAQRDVWEGMYHSTMARHGIHLSISTPQANRKSIGFEEYCRAKDVVDGKKIETNYLPICHGVPENVDYRNTDNWWQHIPSLGITVTKDYYLTEWQRVKDNPRELAAFRTLLLGQWVESLETWIPDSAWQACCDQNLKESDYYGKPAYLGLDTARTSLAATCILIPDGDRLVVFPRFFMPKETADKDENKTRTPWRQWSQMGFVTLTDGDVMCPQTIKNSIIEDSKKFQIHSYSSDCYNFEDSRQDLLNTHGIDIVQIGGTMMAIGDATATFERYVMQKKIVHDGHPILSWNVANAVVKSDQRDRILINRDLSTGRYDGLSALINALNRSIAEPIYQYDGMDFISI